MTASHVVLNSKVKEVEDLLKKFAKQEGELDSFIRRVGEVVEETEVTKIFLSRGGSNTSVVVSGPESFVLRIREKTELNGDTVWTKRETPLTPNRHPLARHLFAGLKRLLLDPKNNPEGIEWKTTFG